MGERNGQFYALFNGSLLVNKPGKVYRSGMQEVRNAAVPV
jgi:hypothetical protein